MSSTGESQKGYQPRGPDKCCTLAAKRWLHTPQDQNLPDAVDTHAQKLHMSRGTLADLGTEGIGEAAPGATQVRLRELRGRPRVLQSEATLDHWNADTRNSTSRRPEFRTPEQRRGHLDGDDGGIDGSGSGDGGGGGGGTGSGGGGGNGSGDGGGDGLTPERTMRRRPLGSRALGGGARKEQVASILALMVMRYTNLLGFSTMKALVYTLRHNRGRSGDLER
ncbi:protein no-on-transient A-like [Penaeus monodon]|uniref:protein no-on-transient A-like n=1 Tax=Penaeus monodon TaxID=6687 RepID=UPI0018A7D58F|nr:protein no-on-transient A-like [Penaeus monodon]